MKLIPIHSIVQYKNAVKKNVGKEISLYLKKGRRTVVINNCILENAYNNIFTIKIIGENLLKESKISVSYADLLIGNARITLKKDIKLA